jgi:hypothetical protein
LKGALLLAIASSCSNDGSDSGPTTITGRFKVPDGFQCRDCAVGNRQLTVSALRANTPPEVVATTTVDPEGGYSITADLVAELGLPTPLRLEIQTGDGASLGGVQALHSGKITKNFDVGTEVAALATLDIIVGTKFTTGNAPDGCEVADNGVCETDQTCFFILYEGFFDDRRIGLLDDAAARIASRVTVEGNIGRAACALIHCTFEGSGSASQACLDGFFP